MRYCLPWETSLLTLLGAVFFSQMCLHPERECSPPGSVPSVGFTSEELPGRVSPSWLGHRYMFFCAQRGGPEADGVDLRGLLVAALASASLGGSAAAHLMTFVL